MNTNKTNSHDLFILSRQWENISLPSDRRFLEKYFTTDIQGTFFRYLYVFGTYDNFQTHTGISISKRYLIKMNNDFKDLISAYIKAKKDFDLETVVRIEDGNFFTS